MQEEVPSKKKNEGGKKLQWSKPEVSDLFEIDFSVLIWFNNLLFHLTGSISSA